MTRIEIPIPEQQPDLAFEFVEREDGLMEFHGESTEAHIAAFRAVNSGIDDHYWSQAAVAASLSTKYGKAKYGDEQMEELAQAVELSVNYLQQIARTYRTFSQFLSRDTNLSFNHHRIAAAYKKPEAALIHARENGLSCRGLEQWISEQRSKDADRITRKAKRAVKTEFLEHLEHVESVIEDDFIKNCPSKDFAQRVYAKGWLAEIKFELRQFNRQANEEIIRAAIEDDGACTLKEIKQATELPMSDVEGFVAVLVAQGEYEWIDKRGEGEDTRGSHQKMLHKVGTNDGGACNVPRAQNSYTN